MSPNGELEDLFTGPDHYGTLAAGKDGDLYVSLPNEGEIHYADGRGALRPFAQGLSRGDVHDFTLAVSSQGVLYAADSNSGSILRFNSDGSHSVVANVPSLFELPNALVVGPDGILFVQTGRIPLKLYKILPTGAKGLVASNVWGDPLGLALDTRGNLYVSRGGTLDRLSGLMVP
jgi:sugar lactone lactonase YvrE